MGRNYFIRLKVTNMQQFWQEGAGKSLAEKGGENEGKGSWIMMT